MERGRGPENSFAPPYKIPLRSPGSKNHVLTTENMVTLSMHFFPFASRFCFKVGQTYKTEKESY